MPSAGVNSQLPIPNSQSRADRNRVLLWELASPRRSLGGGGSWRLGVDRAGLRRSPRDGRIYQFTRQTSWTSRAPFVRFDAVVVRVVADAEHRREPRTVERVQQLGAELEVHASLDRDSLHRAQVEADQRRTRDDEAAHAAVAEPVVGRRLRDLDTVRAVRRRDVPARRCSSRRSRSRDVALTLNARTVLSMMSCGSM